MRILGEYPTEETIGDWNDGVSLVAALGQAATERFGSKGLESLNEAERILACLFDLDGKVNNGGFGMWLHDNLELVAATPGALDAVGSKNMAIFVRRVLEPFGDLTRFDDAKWSQYLAELPKTDHLAFEALSREFVEHESELLKCADAYARKNWQAVRRD